VQVTGAVTMACSVLAFAGAIDWRIDLLNHFRFQYALVLSLATIGSLLLRAWKTGGVFIASLMINLVVLAPLFINSDRVDEVASKRHAVAEPLRLIAINVHTANRRFQAVINYVKSHQPEIVFFQETDAAWIGALSDGLAESEGEYRILEQRARSDNFGLLVMVRKARESQQINQEAGLFVSSSSIVHLDTSGSSVPSAEVRFLWHGKPVYLLCVHTLPPISTQYAFVRDSMLQAAGEHVIVACNASKMKSAHKKSATSDANLSAIIIGDLNATPWCSPFKKLINDTNLIDSSRGYGWQPTWPSAFISISSIPIDHCLHSADLITVRREVGSDANGSDHFPLLVELMPVK
jgi:endonuclease/exonuclease/phosphatase (EEP) superfamily protein YafD